MKTRLTILTILVPTLLVGWGCFTGVQTLTSSRDSQPFIDSSPAVVAPAAAPIEIETPLKSSPAAAPTPAKAPAVDPLLSLKLVGVFMSAGQGDSVAVIQDMESRKVSSYRVGQGPRHGVTLIGIDLRRVTLQRPDGSMGTLKLEEAASTPRSPVTRISPTERLVDIRLLKQQPVSLFLEFSQVKVAPRVEQGKMLGFGVRGAVPKGILNDLGVEEGDVVAAIDGQSLENYQRATELFGGLIQKELSRVTLIKKDGQRLAMTYYISS